MTDDETTSDEMTLRCERLERLLNIEPRVDSMIEWIVHEAEDLMIMNDRPPTLEEVDRLTDWIIAWVRLGRVNRQHLEDVGGIEVFDQLQRIVPDRLKDWLPVAVRAIDIGNFHRSLTRLQELQRQEPELDTVDEAAALVLAIDEVDILLTLAAEFTEMSELPWKAYYGALARLNAEAATIMEAGGWLVSWCAVMDSTDFNAAASMIGSDTTDKFPKLLHSVADAWEAGLFPERSAAPSILETFEQAAKLDSRIRSARPDYELRNRWLTSWNAMPTPMVLAAGVLPPVSVGEVFTFESPEGRYVAKLQQPASRSVGGTTSVTIRFFKRADQLPALELVGCRVELGGAQGTIELQEPDRCRATLAAEQVADHDSTEIVLKVDGKRWDYIPNSTDN